MLLYGCDTEYALGALLVAFTLRRVATQGHLLLLHTADVPSSRLQLLSEFYNDVRLIENPVLVPPDSPLCFCSRDFGHLQFLKLHLLELEFDKVLYLDCDVLVLRNIDHLFQLDAPAAMERVMAMPSHGSKLPNRCTWSGHRIRGIQGGVMLLRPDPELFASMRSQVEHPRELHDLGYTPTMGNEQDYLTWRYCLDKYEERGQAPVWTHLGCEYNYEVHTADMYFAIGRERWLWLNYERDVAVLHFSAPNRKRAKSILQSVAGNDIGTELAPGEDPRVAFAYIAWDLALQQLHKAMTERGLIDLNAWIGEGGAAHASRYAVIDRGEEGMHLQQVDEDATETLENCIFSFEAFSSNCIQGLKFFPLAFLPGPPWGACFWARASPLEAVETNSGNVHVEVEAAQNTSTRAANADDNVGDGAVAGAVVTPFTGNSGNEHDIREIKSAPGSDSSAVFDSASNVLHSSIEERRRYPCDMSDRLYTHDEFIAFALTSNMPGWYGELKWCEAGGDNMQFHDIPLVCNCPRSTNLTKLDFLSSNISTTNGVENVAFVSDSSNELRAVGAWLSFRHPGKEKWHFGLMDRAPHQMDCILWRCAAVFYVKVVS